MFIANGFTSQWPWYSWLHGYKPTFMDQKFSLMVSIILCMQTLAWSLIVTYMEFPLQENTQHRLFFMDHWQTDCYAIENLFTVPLSAAMLQIHLINQSVLADFIHSDWILSLNYVVLKQKLYCYVSQRQMYICNKS